VEVRQLTRDEVRGRERRRELRGHVPDVRDRRRIAVDAVCGELVLEEEPQVSARPAPRVQDRPA
jgi:hypothetical protein